MDGDTIRIGVNALLAADGKLELRREALHKRAPGKIPGGRADGRFNSDVNENHPRPGA